LRPSFVGIGAQKCASSWLYRVLECHPQVGVSKEKEVDFFSYHFDHGYRWYEEKFAHCEARAAVGEVSPSYFCEPAAPSRIHRYLPSARILVSLRDPVERALSNHRHEVRVGHVYGDDLSFDTGLANNPMYVEQGRYATHLKRWLKYFRPEQVLVVLMEDIERDSHAVVRRVYEFLKIDPSYVPDNLSQRDNPSYATRSRLLTNIKDGVYNSVGNTGAQWLWNAGAALGFKALYRHLNVVPSEQVIPYPDASTLAKLRAAFAPEIRELSRLLGRPLDGWLER
jgi:hypothetical protein